MAKKKSAPKVPRKRQPKDVTQYDLRRQRRVDGELEAEVAKLKDVVGTLISWIADSAVGVLSNENAAELLEKLK